MSEQARKILETFKDGSTFVCLSELAKHAGFRNAADKQFKTGFNFLLKKGVLKKIQSGWRSEERGSKNHPKTVILTADILEIGDSEYAFKGTRDKCDLIGLVKETEPDFILVPILTPLGQRSYISKKAYDLEKGYRNFWRPIGNGKQKG